MSEEIPEDAEPWEVYLERWMREDFPVFEKNGFTRGEAFIIWMLNRLDQSVERGQPPNDDEPWKP